MVYGREEGENGNGRRARRDMGGGRECLWEESWVVGEEGDNIVIGLGERLFFLWEEGENSYGKKERMVMGGGRE